VLAEVALLITETAVVSGFRSSHDFIHLIKERMMERKFKRKNMEALLEFVRSLPDEAAYMGVFLGYICEVKPRTTLAEADKVLVLAGDRHICGTAGCLAGWATVLALPSSPKGGSMTMVKLDAGRLDVEVKESSCGYVAAACEWLNMDKKAGHRLFLNFHDEPIDGWQKGMVRVLERVLEVGFIEEDVWEYHGWSYETEFEDAFE